MKRIGRGGARLQYLMGNPELAVLVIAREVEDCNGVACTLLGRTREEIVGRSPLDFSAPEQADGADAEAGGRTRIAGALAGQPQWFPWRFRLPAGGEVPTLVHLECVHVDGRRRLVAHIRDLSPLLRAEVSLRESEYRLRQILDQTDAVVFWKDLTGRYLFVNAAFCGVVGLPVEAVLGRRDEDVMPAEVAARLQANDRRVVQLRRAVAFEEQGVFQGEARTYLVNKFPLLDPAGEPYAVCGIATDISERKRMEEALRASEENYRTIFEASEDCIFLHDFETGAFVDVNPKACQVYGYDYDTLLRLDPGDLGAGEAPYTGADARRWLDRARAGEVVRFEWRRRNSDGSGAWDEVFLKRVRLGGRDRILAVTRDITARKVAAEVIARSEDRLRATVEAALDCIVTMDERGVIRGFNPAAERCFRLTAEAALGRRLDEVLIPERFRSAHRRGMERFLADGHGPFIGRRVEVLAQRADGEEFPAELTIAVAEGAAGRIFVGYLRDITERRRAEDERAALEAQLRQAQKMEAIGHLAGGIAHDFNNILTSITGYLALAGERQEVLADPRLGRYLEQTRRAAGRARDLISQMLAFSRGQRGTPRPIALGALVEELARFLGPTLPGSIVFDVDPGRSPAQVLADPVQLEQVLLNLCINARDALAGSGSIRVAVEPCVPAHGVCASCRATLGGTWVAVSVADDGPGVPPEVAERMFEPFFTTKEVGKGSGMGLATAHGIVHELGGHLLLETAPGRGAVFRVLLPPLAGPGQTTAGGAGEPAELERGRLEGRILLADDERMVAEVLGELLAGWGLDVTLAADGIEARDMLAADPQGYDLVLTDHTMPRMTGLELAREARRLRPGVPVVVFSGYADGLTEEALQEAGARLLLHKPLDPERLFARLAGLLADAQASQAATGP